ncbi:MAG: isochorismatase family protein [Pseudomonadota bacterium]
MAGHPLVIGSSSILISVSEHTYGAPKTLEPQFPELESLRALPHLELAVSLDLSFEVQQAEWRKRITANDGRSLILRGGWLEGAVTQVAITCLIEGLDVFIAADACDTREADYRDWFLKRLYSYGATISTTRQLAMELRTD